VAGHSLRAGFVTSAARAKVPEREIMRHTGHKHPSTLRHYIRQGEMFESSPVRDVDL
jgi:integrase